MRTQVAYSEITVAKLFCVANELHSSIRTRTVMVIVQLYRFCRSLGAWKESAQVKHAKLSNFPMNEEAGQLFVTL